MAKKMKISKEQIRKNHRKVSREIEMEENPGWVSRHKVHKDKKKEIHRKRKHKKED